MTSAVGGDTVGVGAVVSVGVVADAEVGVGGVVVSCFVGKGVDA